MACHYLCLMGLVPSSTSGASGSGSTNGTSGSGISRSCGKLERLVAARVNHLVEVYQRRIWRVVCSYAGGDG
jgi:hypothetical protein